MMTHTLVSQPYAIVATSLRRAIHLGVYPPGTNMPPEREHSEILGVSRSTLRGAVRVLVGEGLVEIRRGATGGVFVRENTESPDLVTARLRERADELIAIMDFRVVNEVFAARQAALKATQVEILEIADSIEAMKSGGTPGELRRADMRFHLGVAATARSPLLLRAVEDARAELFLPFQVVDFTEMLVKSATEHREILDMIENHDPEGAGRAMEKHLATSRLRLGRLLGE
jgi:GntR family transcriptional regulator, transcriptional repressor for pyruvate dehydrogenase complex